MASKIAMFEGVGDPFETNERPSRRRRRRTSHSIKSSKVKRRNEVFKGCALEWRKKKRSGHAGGYRSFMSDCLRKK